MDEPSPAPDSGGWELWRLPARAVVTVLAVEAAAVALVVATLTVPAPRTLGLAAFLTFLSVLHTELATGIERIRRRAAETSYFDLSSVWTFAAALLLPPMLAAAVIVVVYVHLWQRVWRPAKVPLHRHVYTTATVVLAAGAAHGAVQWAGGLPEAMDDVVGVAAVAVAVLLYVVVNTLLVAGAIALTKTRTGLRELVGRWDDNALEIATLCMGALAAVALWTTPALVALVLPPILVLHRAVLVRHLEEAASTDAKTGLLNAAAWQAQAARTVRRVHRAGGTAAVLILDLDHFKLVNDAHGHLAGDDVLAAVAAELRSGVREHDLVGRFGGEEFVVLLPDLPAGPAGRVELQAVAERIRRRVADLVVPVDTADGRLTIANLSVSIGGATVPADGTSLEQVLKVADASLYAAKRGGRNCVRIAGPVAIPAPRSADAARQAAS
ncbi:GGDEF domain-containing protein [Pseudonocardia nigra]|uniref:GGDEF domain-containing protein n=1 Tax=Pseudonocardia nigra TaxID=1921578 RepID=UPI001C5DD58A|nr:GGDEF domain-containing protein [Pseudonocardia nigra]